MGWTEPYSRGEGSLSRGRSPQNQSSRLGLGMRLMTSLCEKAIVANAQEKNLDGKGKCLYTWNMRSLYRPGAIQILINILEKYNVDVMALQEIWHLYKSSCQHDLSWTAASVSYTHLDVYKRQFFILSFLTCCPS